MKTVKSTSAVSLKSSEDLWIVFSFIVAAAIILSVFINAPFKGADHDGAAGCHWGTIARNYIRYGYFATKFGAVENGGLLDPSEFKFITHHPPLIPIILSLALRICGVHEWSIRMVFIIFGLGVLWLLYFFSKELWGRKVAILSCIFTLLTPMYLHFSSVPDMVSITLFFSLATIYSYARWLKTESRSALITMSIMFLLATQSAWEAYYLIPAILYHNFLRDKKRTINILVSVLGILSFSIYLIHTLMLVGPMNLKHNIGSALYRTGIYTTLKEPLFIWNYAKQILIWTWFFFTPFVVILTLLFLIFHFGYHKKERHEKNYNFIPLFFIFGALKYVLFLNLCYHHPQRLYYFSPFFVLSASLMFNTILEKAKQPIAKFTLLFFSTSLVIATAFYFTKPVFLELHENDARRSFALSPSSSYDKDDLENAQFYKKLKNYVLKRISPTDLVLTNSWYPHLRFYLDRNTSEMVLDVPRFQTALEQAKRYKKKALFLFNTGIELSSEQMKLLEHLKTNYSSTDLFSRGWLLIFDLNSTMSQTYI